MAEVEDLLGIETSCEDDATCAVIKAGSGSASRELLAREASARAAVSEFLRGVGK